MRFVLWTLDEVNSQLLMFHLWLHVLLPGVAEGGVQLLCSCSLAGAAWSVLVHATCFQLKSQNCGQTQDLAVFFPQKHAVCIQTLQCCDDSVDLFIF